MSAFGKVVKGRSGVRCDYCGKFSKDPQGAYTVRGKTEYITELAYYGLEGPNAKDICNECATEAKSSVEA